MEVPLGYGETELRVTLLLQIIRRLVLRVARTLVNLVNVEFIVIIESSGYSGQRLSLL